MLLVDVTQCSANCITCSRCWCSSLVTLQKVVIVGRQKEEATAYSASMLATPLRAAVVRVRLPVCITTI